QPAPPLDNAGPERLRDYLARLPEARLFAEEPPAEPAKAKERLRERATRSHKQHAENPDGFVLGLRKSRPDLGGLPFLMAKDCTLAAKQAKQLETMADRIRFSLFASRPLATPEKTPRGDGTKPSGGF